MSRRGPAVHRRAHPHVPTPAPGTPDCCTCGLRLDLRNQLHLTDLPPTDPDVAAAERARIGDKD